MSIPVLILFFNLGLIDKMEWSVILACPIALLTRVIPKGLTLEKLLLEFFIFYFLFYVCVGIGFAVILWKGFIYIIIDYMRRVLKCAFAHDEFDCPEVTLCE